MRRMGGWARLLGTFGAASALAACAHGGLLGGPPPPRIETLVADDGANAKLSYGRSLSGAPLVTLECAHGERRMHLLWPEAPVSARTLALTSGEDWSTMPARSGLAEGRRVLAADGPAGLSALSGFRRTGRLQMRAGTAALALNVDVRDLEAVDRFFGLCSPARA